MLVAEIRSLGAVEEADLISAVVWLGGRKDGSRCVGSGEGRRNPAAERNKAIRRGEVLSRGQTALQIAPARIDDRILPCRQAQLMALRPNSRHERVLQLE